MIGLVRCWACRRMLRVSDAWLSVQCPHCEHITVYQSRDVFPDVLRGSSVVERGSHKPDVEGSIPSPATNA